MTPSAAPAPSACVTLPRTHRCPSTICPFAVYSHPVAAPLFPHAQVVEELRTNARKTNASLLIDEFFFEYHFRTPKEPALHTYWPSRTRGGSIDDAVALMYELRAQGIRAHFWI